MMNNAQLDNEKGTLIFEVDMLKDMQEEQEEMMMELQRETRDKHRVCRKGKKPFVVSALVTAWNNDGGTGEGRDKQGM